MHGRPTTLHPLGKCSEDRLDIAMPSAFKEQIRTVAAMNGQDSADWAREILGDAVRLAWYRMKGTLPPGWGNGNGTSAP